MPRTLRASSAVVTYGVHRTGTDNPCNGVAPPDRGARKVKQYLWPVEFAALMDCAAVPLEWRRIYALAVYLHCRPGELEALEWSDLDLVHRTVHLHQAVHYDTGAIKPVKTQEARRFAFEPALLPLLRAMHAESTGSRVLRAELPKGTAEMLREHLKLAGVTRRDLFTSDATRKPMTFYDLRATGITWRAIRGDEPLRIQRAAGHTGFDTTQGYIREAESVRGEGFGVVFPPLPLALSAAPRSVATPAAVPPASAFCSGPCSGERRRPTESFDSAGLSVVRGGGLEPAYASPEESAIVQKSLEGQGNESEGAELLRTPPGRFTTGSTTRVVDASALETPLERLLATQSALWRWADEALAADVEALS
jgi:hypothetical protein